MLVYFYPIPFYFSLALLMLALIILRLKGNNPYQILFAALFGCYLIGAISVAVFPFAVDISNSGYRLNFNLIPFNFGGCFDYLPQNCLKDIFNNILLTLPFGFGIHFLARIRPKQVLWLTMLVGCSFELIQLIMMVILRVGFRSIDINDIIFNTTGAFIGYGLFKLFGWLYLSLIRKSGIQPKCIFAYIYETLTPFAN